MTVGDSVAVLDLLAQRGVAAWLVDEDPVAGARLLVEFGGFDTAVGLLIRRGFSQVVEELPERVELAHPRYGRLVLLPAGFTTDGAAVWERVDGGQVRVPPAAFDPLHRVPRRVRLRHAGPGDAPHGP
jgi:hypothetical protein